MAEKQSRQDVNVPLLVTIGLVCSILLLVIVVGTQAWYRYEAQRQWEQKVLPVQNRELRTLNAEQRANLQGGQWANNEQTRATISIEQAMSLLTQGHNIAERGSKPTTEPATEPTT